jgi:hypothetical protein
MAYIALCSLRCCLLCLPYARTAPCLLAFGSFRVLTDAAIRTPLPVMTLLLACRAHVIRYPRSLR